MAAVFILLLSAALLGSAVAMPSVDARVRREGGDSSSRCSLREWREYEDFEYSYNNRMLAFDQAVTACTNCGGQLTTAINDDEFALTQRIFVDLSGSDNVPHWLAATDRDTEGDWTWLDGTAVSYTNWKRREPDNKDENGNNADCLVVNNKGQWRDQKCNHTRKSLCRRPIGTEVSPLDMCVDTENAYSTHFPPESPYYESTSCVYESSYEPTSYVYEPTYYLSQSPSYESTSYAYESSYPPSERPYYSPSYEPTLSPDEISTYSPTPTPDYYPIETPAYYYTEGCNYSPSNEPSHSPSAPTTRSSSEGPEYYTSVEYPSSGSAGAATSQYGTGSTMSDVITGLSTPSGQESSDGRSVRGNTGYITSPNFPGLYPRNLNYEITVTLDQAGPQTVQLTLDAFDLERESTCSYDYVIINGDVTNKLCGMKSGEIMTVEVPDDTFTVTMRSDSSVQWNGFNISYTVEQEGGKLEGIEAAGDTRVPTAGFSNRHG